MAAGAVRKRGILGAAGALFFVAAMAAFAFTGAAPSCEDRSVGGDVQTVKVGGKWFHLELALDPATQSKGLGQREFIEDDGGMLFVFKRAEPRSFVMRDCPIPIDIVFLDGAGRVVSMYAMVPEAPRGEGEGAVGEVNRRYEDRLKPYHSRFASQFVLEFKGGTLEKLALKPGDKIDLDWAALARRAE